MGKILKIALRRDELELKFGGGIPANALVLIEGEDGAGKSIMSQRLAYGLLEHGHSVSYISSELNLHGFIAQMDSVDYKITERILDEKLIFIPLFPQLGNVRLKKNFMQELLQSKKIFQSEIIIIDTLSFLLINDETTKDDSFNLMSFIKKISALNKTIIFTVNHTQINQTFLSILRSMVDVYLKVEAKVVLGNLLRIIQVVRYNRSESEVTMQIPFKVTPNVGVSIELASLS